MFRVASLLIAGSVLTGCNFSIFNGKGNEQLAFDTNSVEVLIDQPVNNPFVSPIKLGTVSWQSSQPDVAAVNADSGAIQLLDDGQTVISAEIFINGLATGNSASYTLTVSKYEQNTLDLAFDDLVLIKGVTFSESQITGVQGNADMTFLSEDETIVSVDPQSGQLNPVATGDTTISATISETSLFAEATVSYDIAVRNGITDLRLSLGEKDTLLEWESVDTEMSILVTTDLTCESDNLQDCSELQRYPVAPGTKTTLNINSINVVTNGQLFIEGPNFITNGIVLEPKAQPFSNRANAGFASIDDKLIFFGGITSQDTDVLYDDIWMSDDGINWQQSQTTFPVGKIESMGIVPFNGGILSIGGNAQSDGPGTSYYVDGAWFTENGEDWQFIQEQSPNTGGSSIATWFKNRIWSVVGGSNTETQLRSSVDGEFWQQESIIPESASVINGQLVVLDDHLILMLGQDGNFAEGREIWRTADGKTWELLADFSNDPNMRLMSHWRVNVFQDNMLIYAGALSPGDNSNLIFSSEDGVHFERHPAFTWPFLGFWTQFTEFNNKLYAYSYQGLANIWQSSDGITWRTPIEANIQWRY